MASGKYAAPEMTGTPNLAGAIPSFVVGQDYLRKRDIHLNYGGSRQSGISSSAVCPAIFVFTGDSGEQFGYTDGFDAAGVFSYSGEGQVGDMVFKSGNRSLRDHAKDGRAVYLFHALGKGKPCRYKAEFAVANHSIVRGRDKNGAERDIIVFHMLRVDAAQGAPASTTQHANLQSVTSLEEARKRALAACSGPAGAAGHAAVRTLYQRSQAVRHTFSCVQRDRARGAVPLHLFSALMDSLTLKRTTRCDYRMAGLTTRGTWPRCALHATALCTSEWTAGRSTSD